LDNDGYSNALPLGFSPKFVPSLLGFNSEFIRPPLAGEPSVNAERFDGSVVNVESRSMAAGYVSHDWQRFKSWFKQVCKQFQSAQLTSAICQILTFSEEVNEIVHLQRSGKALALGFKDFSEDFCLKTRGCQDVGNRTRRHVCMRGLNYCRKVMQ